MKKIVLTLVAVMSMTMAFAGNAERKADTENSNLTAEYQNYDMSVDYTRIGLLLNLNPYQMEGLKTLHTQYVREMNEASRADKKDRKDLVKEATDKDLEYMSMLLNKKQYAEFAELINVTLQNRGLK